MEKFKKIAERLLTSSSYRTIKGVNADILRLVTLHCQLNEETEKLRKENAQLKHNLEFYIKKEEEAAKAQRELEALEHIKEKGE